MKNVEILNVCYYSLAQFMMFGGVLPKYSQKSKA